MYYRPFRNANEFINTCLQLNGGIWVKKRKDNVICLIIEISDWGVLIGNQTFFTPYEMLYQNYEFFNKMPCGVTDKKEYSWKRKELNKND